MRKRLIAILQAVGILFTMSLGTVLTKIALADVAPFTFAWTSIGVGMIVLSIYTFLIRKERIPRKMGRQVWLIIIAIGVCNFAISRLTRPIALQRLPVTTATYVGNFIGFLTMGMSVIILREYPSIFQLLGAGVAIGGLTVYFRDPLQAAELVGILVILMGITAVAFTNNIARKLALLTKNGVSNNIVSTLALLVGGVVAIVAGLLFDFPPRVPDLKSWGVILYTGIVNISLGLTVWNHILRTLRSFEASILGASTIIYSTVLAMLILGERLALHQWIGMGLMLVGLVLVQVRKGKLNTLFRRLTRRPADPEEATPPGIEKKEV
jgi:drug/metabolite transporter (DMT)-like permease